YGGIGSAQQLDILDSFANEVGFKTTRNVVEIAIGYPKYRDAKGQFEGWLAKAGTSGEGPYDATARLAYFFYTKSGINFLGFSTNGRSEGAGDPEVESAIEKAQVEYDSERRKAIVQDLQRYLAKKQYGVFWRGGTSGFSLAWPVVGNYG